MKLRNSQVAIKVSPLAIAVASALFTGAVITPSAQAKATDQTLDTITVTGEKLDRSLQETTSAVTVFTEDQLAHNTDTVTDIVTSAPNVNYEGFGNISIRGVTGSGGATGGVAFYSSSNARISTVIDGVAQSWSGYNYTPNGLWDTKQVEVLRGPQTMTQGTNSTGGAIVVTTNDPTYDWESAVRVGTERYENSNTTQNLAVMVSGPILEDELAFRIAFDGQKGDTWLNYDAADTELDDDPDVEALQNTNLRAKLLWEPASMPKLHAKLTLTSLRSQGTFTNWTNDSDSDFSTQTQTLDDTATWGTTRLQNSDMTAAAIDVDYDVSSQTKNTTHLDYSYTNIYFYTYPNDSLTLDQGKHNVTFENRTLYKGDGSQLLAGVYVSHHNEDLAITTGLDAETEKLTSALYGEYGYNLTERFQATIGARLQRDELKRDISYSTYSYDKNVTDLELLPKVGVNYSLSPNTTIGATVQKGYNSAGNGVDFYGVDDVYYSYDKETVIAYETGIKSQVTPNLSIAANLFYNDFTDYQALSSADFAVTNLDSAKTYGAELEGDYWATENLQLRSSVGLLRTSVSDDDLDNVGEELPLAPDYNLSAGLTQYLTDNLSVGGDVTYVSDYYSEVTNDSDLKAGDYMTANLKLQYLYGPLTFDAYVKNLTDEDVVYMKQTSRGSERASVGQTRTMGLMVTYKM